MSKVKIIFYSFLELLDCINILGIRDGFKYWREEDGEKVMENREKILELIKKKY